MFEIFSLKNGLENVDGFYCGGVNVGFKKEGFDVGFIRSDESFEVSGVFTSNVFKAAPIRHFLRYKKGFKSNFILANSKNANAMTGEAGVSDIDDIFANLSSHIELINPIMSSTGVIGYRLKKENFYNSFDKFDFNSKNSDAFASAVMTTDTFKKELAFKVCLDDGTSFNIAAVCKGAGMINPCLATMLCFVLTDANIPKSDMDELLSSSVKQSFNLISTDGDTSTNDTVFLCSSGKNGYDKLAFKTTLDMITKNLAMMILKDGEGSNKVVAFEIKGAKDESEAKKAATMLSNSLLVKTALFGEDPNWGRIASTIGASGVECYEDRLNIYFDDLLIFGRDKFGNVKTELDAETEMKAHKIMQKDSFKITCELGVGQDEFTTYGCDLSHKYVEINSDYRS
ncbi:MAG: bifunctional glutamate N-acetyltransferase/amino-acid acetyltransferase ArgJ [Campylobacter sp.]|nr:bifunctional glutamate N-acetyltransferase/amino-acid acetyltransferase ArgJ [Campylobacter sp.]